MAGLQNTLITRTSDPALSMDVSTLFSRCLVIDMARSAIASSPTPDSLTRHRFFRHTCSSSSSTPRVFSSCPSNIRNQSSSNFRLDASNSRPQSSLPLACAALTSAAGEAALVEEDVKLARSRGSLRAFGDSLLEDALDAIKLPSSIRVEDGSFANAMEVVQFLLQLWISKNGLRTIATKHPDVLKIKLPDLNLRVQYFLDRGIGPGEAGSSILRDPSWLFVPIQQIERIAAYLEDTGLSREKIPKVLLKYPDILQLDPEASMDSTVDYLGNLIGAAGFSLQRMLERQPGVLQLADSDIAERTAVMEKYGLSPEAISNLVFMKPSILLLEPEILSDRFENLTKIFLRRRLPNIFKVAPSLLCVSPDRINRQFVTLKEYLGPEVAERAVNSFPQALSLSWERVLLPKLEYLQELGLQSCEVVNFPAYLGYSLPERIRPRCELLLKEGFSIAPHDEVINSDAEKKLRKFGRSHRELLNMEGTHHVCIQHIVGLRDEEFELRFGVQLERVPMRSQQLTGVEFDESDVEELEEFENEVLGDEAGR